MVISPQPSIPLPSYEARSLRPTQSYPYSVQTRPVDHLARCLKPGDLSRATKQGTFSLSTSLDQEVISFRGTGRNLQGFLNDEWLAFDLSTISARTAYIARTNDIAKAWGSVEPLGKPFMSRPPSLQVIGFDVSKLEDIECPVHRIKPHIHLDLSKGSFLISYRHDIRAGISFVFHMCGFEFR